MDEKKHINSIKRAIAILSIYKKDRVYLGVTEISKATNLQKSTVHRIVTTLEGEGWLVKDKFTRKYRLGFRILNIASQLRGIYDYRSIALEEMERLCDRIDETVILSVLTEAGGLCIDKVESKCRIKLTSQPGESIPLHCGATGKILLSYANEQTIKSVISKKLVRYTPDTVTDVNILLQQIKEIKKKGYVISYGENDEGVLGIGAPILDTEEKLIYGLSIAGPLNRCEKKNIDYLVGMVVQSANVISKKIAILKQII